MYEQRAILSSEYPNLLAHIVFAPDDQDQSSILASQPASNAMFAQFSPEKANLGVYSFSMSVLGAFDQDYFVVFYAEKSGGFNLEPVSVPFQIQTCDSSQTKTPYPPDTQEYSICVNKPKELHQRV